MIAPMKFVTLVVLRDDREQVLQALQKSGCLMLCEREGAVRADAEAAEALRRMEKLIADIKPYKPKKGLFAENPQVESATFDTPQAEDLQTAEKLEELLSALAQNTQRCKQLADTIRTLEPWETLSEPVEALRDTVYTRFTIGRIPIAKRAELQSLCEQNDVHLQAVSQDETSAYVILAQFASDPPVSLSEIGFEAVTLPLQTGLVFRALADARGQLEETQALADRQTKELQTLAESTDAPFLLCEQYRAQSDLEDAPFLQTTETAILEGWTPEKRLKDLEKAVQSVTEIYDLSARDPEEGEDVPIELQNNHVVSQFEGITNMFSVPQYGGYDPNAVMAPWYWLIFGMMMGDAGYGLLMAVLILILKKLMKPKGETAKLMQVLLYSSVTTILCGVLFGSYFGETWHPILFSPLDDPVKMLIVTLGIGVAHIFTGLIVQIVNQCRAHHFADAIFDQVSWMLVIGGICLIFLKPARTVGIILAAVGAGIILCTAGRAKKGVVGKITGGLVGLYGITNYLSDILSYSRILALSLATGVVGMVMNMLAGMIQGSVIGFILSLLIYIVGHVFNLVLGLLSAYVHDCRLQYIEFYGKFYDGGGRLFKPLSINPKYIQIKENGGN